MRTLSLPCVLAATATLCFADVEFTSPAAGASESAGAITMAWKDSGSAPALADLVTYQIDLMAGGDTDADSAVITNLVPPNTRFSGSNAALGVVSTAIGGSAENAYYLRITSVATAGGQMINFSPRFSITGMTGTFSAAVLNSLPPKSTSARAGINQVAADNGAGAPVAQADDFDTPYGQQTGRTRYAPMMIHPPSVITKQNTAPLYPTSGYTIAKAFLTPATVETTLTQSNTYTVSQIENTAVALAGPNAAAMQKFLDRWRD